MPGSSNIYAIGDTVTVLAPNGKPVPGIGDAAKQGGKHAAKAIRAGVVWVNCFDRGNMSVPFGGFKQSGHGRDKSLHAIEKYTDWKATWYAC